MTLLTHPDVGGDKKFFKTIKQAYQILTNDAPQEAYNIFGQDKAETPIDDKNCYLNFQCKSTNFFVKKDSQILRTVN